MCFHLNTCLVTFAIMVGQKMYAHYSVALLLTSPAISTKSGGKIFLPFFIFGNLNLTILCVFSLKYVDMIVDHLLVTTSFHSISELPSAFASVLLIYEVLSIWATIQNTRMSVYVKKTELIYNWICLKYCSLARDNLVLFGQRTAFGVRFCMSLIKNTLEIECVFYYGGDDQNRTDEWEFCRLVPYRLATSPDL